MKTILRATIGGYTFRQLHFRVKRLLSSNEDLPNNLGIPFVFYTLFVLCLRPWGESSG